MLRDTFILWRIGRKEKADSMIAPTCQHNETKRHGHDRNGNQRFRCILCGKTWIEERTKLFGEMRIEEAKALQVLEMLLEGVSIRSTVRITGVAKGTILSLLALVGRRAQYYWNVAMRNVHASNVQVDEVWGYVYAKEKTCVEKLFGPGHGDAYTFLAIERDTKLILTWHLGRRDTSDTIRFADKLRIATAGRFQLTSDGFTPYTNAIPDAFGGEVDFAQLIKEYGKLKERKAEARYSPADIIGIRKIEVWGRPNMDTACTSHIERANLSVRMGIRRMTRLTNAFSKKWENHEAHIGLWLLYYNFCRAHATLSKGRKATTPAMASGLADHRWTLAELLNHLATHC